MAQRCDYTRIDYEVYGMVFRCFGVWDLGKSCPYCARVDGLTALCYGMNRLVCLLSDKLLVSTAGRDLMSPLGQ